MTALFHRYFYPDGALGYVANGEIGVVTGQWKRGKKLSMLVGGIALLAVCWFPFGACSPDGDDT